MNVRNMLKQHTLGSTNNFHVMLDHWHLYPETFYSLGYRPASFCLGAKGSECMSCMYPRNADTPELHNGSAQSPEYIDLASCTHLPTGCCWLFLTPTGSKPKKVIDLYSHGWLLTMRTTHRIHGIASAKPPQNAVAGAAHCQASDQFEAKRFAPGARHGLMHTSYHLISERRNRIRFIYINYTGIEIESEEKEPTTATCTELRFSEIVIILETRSPGGGTHKWWCHNFSGGMDHSAQSSTSHVMNQFI